MATRSRWLDLYQATTRVALLRLHEAMEFVEAGRVPGDRRGRKDRSLAMTNIRKAWHSLIK